jgi:hypothetical protein
MAQATLLSNIASEVVGIPVRLNSPSSVTLQFTPLRDGFTATILVEATLVPNVDPGYLWYSIATIGENPWFIAATLEFSNHSTVLAFTLSYLNPGNRWIRASVIQYERGTISAHLAH